MLASLAQLTLLCGVLGLDAQCETCASALAAHCGLWAPAPRSSPAEEKQLAALRVLLGLAAVPEAAYLGSAWVVLLRAVSGLQTLKVRWAEWGLVGFNIWLSVF